MAQRKEKKKKKKLLPPAFALFNLSPQACEILVCVGMIIVG